MTLTLADLRDIRRARQDQWAQAVAEGPAAMHRLRTIYASNGWKMCRHETCPPFDCEVGP